MLGVLQSGLNLLYPPVCQLCHTRRAEASDGFVCGQCWRQVRFIRPPFCHRCGLPFAGEFTTDFVCTNCHDLQLHFSSARSAVVAKSVVLEAIHRFKYSRALWFENFLASLLVPIDDLQGDPTDLILDQGQLAAAVKAASKGTGRITFKIDDAEARVTSGTVASVVRSRTFSVYPIRYLTPASRSFRTTRSATFSGSAPVTLIVLICFSISWSTL